MIAPCHRECSSVMPKRIERSEFSSVTNDATGFIPVENRLLHYCESRISSDMRSAKAR